MKKAILVAMFSLMMVSTAIALPLLPGGGVVPDGTASPGGTLLASIINTPFTGTDVSGNVYFTGLLSQWVRQNTTGILFEYQFSNAISSLDPIARMSTTDFSGWMTNVNSLINGGVNPSPASISRSGSGSTVSFDYSSLFGGYSVGQGQTTSLAWIQTNAPTFTWGSTVLLDGGRAAVRTYAPAVPEPGSLMLLGTGLLGLLGYGKARFGKKA